MFSQVPCLLHDFGCKDKATRATMEDHYGDKHVVMLVKYIHNLEDKIEEMNKRIKLVESTYNQEEKIFIDLSNQKKDKIDNKKDFNNVFIDINRIIKEASKLYDNEKYSEACQKYQEFAENVHLSYIQRDQEDDYIAKILSVCLL